MHDRRFDRVAVLLAASHPRRRTLRFLAAAILGVAGVTRSPRPAAAALCPERVPKPGYTPTANGCGPGGFADLVPETWKRADFAPACNRHDVCYGTCNSDRTACDDAFLSHLRKACRRAYRGDTARERDLYRRCRRQASAYYVAVSDFGQGAYEDAQASACLCCGEGGRGPKCGGVCCPDGLVCADPASGRCRTPEGAGGAD